MEENLYFSFFFYNGSYKTEIYLFSAEKRNLFNLKSFCFNFGWVFNGFNLSFVLHA